MSESPPQRRTIIIQTPSPKDSNGAYTKTPAEAPASPPTPPSSGVSLDDLLNKQLLVLFRQTVRFLEASTSGLLNKDQEQAFDRCVRLTRELKKDEKALFDKLSSDDLEKLANGDDE